MRFEQNGNQDLWDVQQEQTELTEAGRKQGAAHGRLGMWNWSAPGSGGLGSGVFFPANEDGVGHG